MLAQAQPAFGAAAPSAGGGNLFAQMPSSQIQAPPIYYAPRRPINLQALQAQLQRPPILSQG
jgi:hypothetical protein